jgi:hypothetical protein
MQPIAQASLDPKMNDIRQLRADQEFCGVIGCFSLICLTSFGTVKEPFPMQKNTGKNGNSVFVCHSAPDRNLLITPFPERLRERREFGARIRPDGRRIIGTWLRAVPIRGEFESLKPRKTLVKVLVKANRPTFLDVGLHL